jgi:hypothetical protein
MTSIENQPQQNRRLRTWPFRRHRTVLNEDTNRKVGCKINLDSELDLRHRDSLRSIFMTDASKMIHVSERNIYQNLTPTMTSMNTG